MLETKGFQDLVNSEISESQIFGPKKKMSKEKPKIRKSRIMDAYSVIENIGNINNFKEYLSGRD